MVRTICWLSLFGAMLATALATVERTQCRDDQAIEWGRVCLKCQVDHCASCKDSGIYGCDTCRDGFYQEEEGGECFDATCQIKRCALCESTGPEGCEQCDEGFFFNKLINICQSSTCLLSNCVNCIMSGPSLCDACEDGYEFNRESAVCEDKMCKMKFCEDCSKSGIWGCDRCEEGFYFDLETGKCEDASCKTKYCDKCDAHPTECEVCAPGFWLNKQLGTCEPAACKVDNCDVCDTEGPSVCDKCAPGHFMKSPTVCKDCDIYPLNVQCLECDNESRCTKCNVGFRLDQATGTCVTCNEDTCAECNVKTGACNKCKSGHYLDKKKGTCFPCSGDCLECDGKDSCLLCDESVHMLSTPEDGQCECDAFRHFEPHPNGEKFKCQCQQPYLTPDNKCADCNGMINGCIDCSLAEDQENSKGVSVVASELFPTIAPGKYECTKCSKKSTYYEPFTQKCEKCTESIDGCSKCSVSGETCTSCKKWYTLEKNGESCYNCRFYDPHCDRCDMEKCLDCEPGWAKFFVGKWFSCVKDFF